MNRIYHTWDKWECYPAGFYESKPASDLTPKECEAAYRELLQDSVMFEAALFSVITEWKRSCEHYLSNEKMNRIAWLGQAALCMAKGIPSCFRGGFNLLTEQEQIDANNMALRYLNKWLEKRGEPIVTMEGAGVNAQVNLY
jgi:hypothetical protein